MMKFRFDLRCAAMALGCLVAASSASAEPTGVWKTEQGSNGGYLHVKIAPCGALFCGTIDEAFGANPETAKSLVGKKMIWDMAAKGNGRFDGGKIWAPDQDKTYRAKMTETAGALKVEGCVAGGLLCRGQTWTRVQ